MAIIERAGLIPAPKVDAIINRSRSWRANEQRKRTASIGYVAADRDDNIYFIDWRDYADAVR